MPKIERPQIKGLLDTFKSPPECRKKLLNVNHKLHDIVAISVMAVIAGADGPTDIFQWASCTACIPALWKGCFLTNP